MTKPNPDHWNINPLNLGNIGDLFGDDQSPPQPSARVRSAIHAIHRVLLPPDHCLFIDGVLILSGRLGLPYFFNYGAPVAMLPMECTIERWTGGQPGRDWTSSTRHPSRLRRWLGGAASRLGGGVKAQRVLPRGYAGARYRDASTHTDRALNL